MPTRRLSIAISSLLVLIALIRILASYSHTAQAFDEPCHVAAGIEFLDKKTYALDPVHPPLSRIAIALPLYLAGERFPYQATENDNYNVVGNHILYDSGHLRRNLALARLGVLPFFILGAAIVFLWTRRIAGRRSAVLAVFLYTTTPTILAFSSIAYTDIVAASTQTAALFGYSLCLENRSRSHTLWFALALGLALLSKLTTVLFLPAAALCMFLVWILKTDRAERGDLRRHALHWLAAGAIALVILWGGYRFSFKPVQQVTGLTPASMPTFQHFPGFARPILTQALTENVRLPAPELFNGISHAWVLNKLTSKSYLLGELKSGGWWYFYLVAIVVKLPISFLIAFALSTVVLLKQNREFRTLLPLAAIVGVLLITMHVSYQVGVRHVLLCLPLMAITAAAGLRSLTDNLSLRSATTLLLLTIVAWQLVETARAQRDFLAYFNEFAGKDPGRVLSTGCDFDCGQDLYALADELQARRVPRLTLAIWSSADITRSGLPPYDLPKADIRPQGWIAVSSRAFHAGDVLHQSLPPHTFDWLQAYAPVTKIGKTINLYYIDDVTTRTGN